MSEDVSKFLEQVKELGDRRVEEDEARSRELEEKILQDRKERQARREERARSISPQKSSPANTPPPSAHRTSTHAADRPRPELESSPILDPPAISPSGEPRQLDSMNAPTSFSSSPTKENESPFDAENKRTSGAVSPTRSGSTARGLSWQRRPNSQGRPLSVVAAENAARSTATPAETSPASEGMSRDDIAQSLSSKDPSWFRQTADRGLTSDAYRKSQVEDEQRMDMSAMKTELPGMPRRESESTTSRPVSRGPGSPLSLSGSQKLDPPGDSDAAHSDPRDAAPLGSPSLGRTSPTKLDRPVSPTKGMGGFVQSAMMKRSDSVNKRWSVTSPTGLQRADSVVSNRNSQDQLKRRSTVSRPTSMVREASATEEPSTSRPASSHGHEGREEDGATSSKVHTPLSTDTKIPPESQAQDAEKATPPTSPSRPIDQRRWSPTKASWLESALNKPESPKPKPAPPPSNQPAWMAELAKAKAQKAANANPEAEKKPAVSHKHEVSIGGLMRPPPPGAAAKPAITPGVAGSTPTGPRHTYGSLSHGSQSSITGDSGNGEQSKPDTPPKKDFRASLKSRPPPPPSSGSENELKSVFGTLRKTTTQNYVAPDELKNNILRGKAGLNITGGPQKTERKDEFKEAILAKKKEFQQVQSEGKGVSRTNSNASETPVPEGLVKKMELGRSRSNTANRNSVTSDTMSALESKRSSTTSNPRKDSTPLVTPTFPEPPGLSGRKDSTPQVTPNLTERSGSLGKNETAPEPASVEPRRPSLANRFSSKDLPLGKPENDVPPASNVQKETGAPGRIPGRLAGNALANRFNPALAGLLARGPPTASSPSTNLTGSATKSGSSDASDERESASGPKLTHMTKGRARGPKRKAPSSATNAAPVGESTSAPSPKEESHAEVALKPEIPPSEAVPKASPLPSPKPQDASRADPSKSAFDDAVRPRPSRISLIDTKKTFEPDSQVSPVKSPESPSKKHTRSPSKKIHDQVAALASQRSTSRPASPTKGEPEQPTSQPTSPKKLDLRRMSRFLDESSQVSPKPAEREEPEPNRVSSPADIESKPLGGRPSSPAVQASEVRPPSRSNAEASQSETKPKPLWGKPSIPALQTQEARSPSPKTLSKPSSPALQSRPEVRPPSPKALSKPASPALPTPVIGSPSTRTFSKPDDSETSRPNSEVQSRLSGGLRSPSAVPAPPPQSDVSADAVDSAPANSVKSGLAMFGGGRALPPLPPPEPASRPLPPEPTRSPQPNLSSRPPSPTPGVSPMRSPTKQRMEVNNVLAEFFGTERPKRDYRVDTAEILMNRPNNAAPQIRTLEAQLYQFAADGKKVPVPAHHERVLFEQEMYLCSHTFNNAAGKKTSEMYLWAGDEVPSSTVEDASVFAARDAKALGGKLVKLQQGKESPEFMAALGGIVITQRGSSQKYDSLTPHMLCGRRYLGQVVFDEVEFSPAALCSGFPYIVTNAGRCYLWKGKGSCVDELGCARLIGMDYALSGEMEEVEDGHEPDSFWATFNGGSKLGSADHWRLKPNYDKYCSRLFCSDAASKQQITEISPFNQADLKATSIYVLDAFFELYIVVGAHAQPQYASFHNALDFAQEYAILAAGMEDRPFVPISTVVLEGIPRDMKSVFRKWRDADSPTIMNAPGSSTGLRRGRSLRIMPLNQALQALSE